MTGIQEALIGKTIRGFKISDDRQEITLDVTPGPEVTLEVFAD